MGVNLVSAVRRVKWAKATKRTHRRVVLVVAADARHPQFRRKQTPKRKMAHLYSSGLVSFRVEYIPEVWL